MQNENVPPPSSLWYAPKELDTNWCDHVEWAAFRRLAHGFTFNVNRFLQIPEALVYAYGRGTYHERLYHEAQIIALGNVQIVKPGAAFDETAPNFNEAIMQVDFENWQKIHEVFSKLLDGSLKQDFTISGLSWIGHQPLRSIESACGPQFKSILQTQIIGVWTAFEALVGDLWEEALNGHPNCLAELGGIPKRIAKSMGTKTEKRETSTENEGPTDAESKQVDLNDIRRLTKGNYNLQDKMGKLLRGRFKFTTLAGIRKAYSAAFSEHYSSIDNVLTQKSLDALALVRNVLVHKAGIADEDYVDDSKSVPLAPKLTVEQRLELDGELAHNLIDPVILCGKNLIVAVDKWITAHS